MNKHLLKKEFDHAVVKIIPPHTLLIEASAEYIPISNFKQLFTYAGEVIKESGLTRLIFDKRSMRVFDQPSMEWYFIDWKADMADHGLTIHRKILPDHFAFRESVKLGRKKIARENPDGKFNELDIRYSNSVEEALKE